MTPRFCPACGRPVLLVRLAGKHLWTALEAEPSRDGDHLLWPSGENARWLSRRHRRLDSSGVPLYRRHPHPVPVSPRKPLPVPR